MLLYLQERSCCCTSLTPQSATGPSVQPCRTNGDTEALKPQRTPKGSTDLVRINLINDSRSRDDIMTTSLKLKLVPVHRSLVVR